MSPPSVRTLHLAYVIICGIVTLFGIVTYIATYCGKDGAP